MSGLLVMLLAGPICLLLAVSVVGIAVVPFVMCALLIAAIFGKIAFARWIGASVVHQDEPDNRALSMRSFLIGSAIMCVAYMIPVLGFVTWALAGVFGLGASTVAFFSAYRRENPRPPRKVKVRRRPRRRYRRAGVRRAVPLWRTRRHRRRPWPTRRRCRRAEEPLYAAVAAPGEPVPVAAASELVDAATRGVHRSARGVCPRRDPHRHHRATCSISIASSARVGFLLALTYHVSFWTLKGTTLGGIICQLRLVRTDGARVGFPDALVRGLTASSRWPSSASGFCGFSGIPIARHGTTASRAPTS